MNDITVEELERIRLAAKTHAEGLSSVLGPMLERHCQPKPQTPEEFRKHWRYVFAASAMQMKFGRRGTTVSMEEMAKHCREIADTMLTELERMP